MTSDEALDIVREAKYERRMHVAWEGYSLAGFRLHRLKAAKEVLTLTRAEDRRWSAEVSRDGRLTETRDVTAAQVRALLDEMEPLPSVDVVIEKLRAKRPCAEKLAKILDVLAEP